MNRSEYLKNYRQKNREKIKSYNSDYYKKIGPNKYYKKKGFARSLEYIQRLRDAITGERNPRWKGGITKHNKSVSIRSTWEYKKWRESVLKRDNKKCVLCQSIERLEADHIKPVLYFQELLFDISNGRTLCRECHKKTDTYGSKVLNYVMVGS